MAAGGHAKEAVSYPCDASEGRGDYRYPVISESRSDPEGSTGQARRACIHVQARAEGPGSAPGRCERRSVQGSSERGWSAMAALARSTPHLGKLAHPERHSPACPAGAGRLEEL